jgi:O-antigen ligase
MATMLGLAALIWVAVLLIQISRHGFILLLVWLLIAPVATNIVDGDGNPFFKRASAPKVQSGDRYVRAGDGYKEGGANVRLRELTEPTRNVVAAFLLVLMLNYVVQRKGLLPLDRTEIAILVFSIILLTSVFLQSNRLFFGLHTAGDAFIVPLLGYCIARRFVTSEERFTQLTRIFGCLGGCLILVCTIERLLAPGLIYRITGPFSSPSNLNMALTPIFYALLLNERQSLPRFFHGLAMFLIAALVLLTFTRGNWVGFLSGVCVCVYLGRRLVQPLRRFEVIGLFLIFAAFVGLTGPLFIPEEIIERRVGDVNTVNWRFARWQVAIEEGLANPIFGSGLNNMRDALGREGLNFSAVHNAFLSLFAELGIVGLVSYLAIVVSIFQIGSRLYRMGVHAQDRWRGIAIIAAMTTYQVPGLFNNEFYSQKLGAIYLFVFIGAVAGVYSRSACVRRPFMAFNSQRWTRTASLPYNGAG